LQRTDAAAICRDDEALNPFFQVLCDHGDCIRTGGIFKENFMSLGTILLILLILMLIGSVPSWPHSRSWGYGPSGALGLIVIVIVVLLLTGRL